MCCRRCTSGQSGLRSLPIASDHELQATVYSEQARCALPHRAARATCRRPQSELGLRAPHGHRPCEFAPTARRRAVRRKRPEAARHTGLRPARSASRVLRHYPTVPRLVSSRLISSRQLPSDGTTIRPKSAVVISSFVLDPKVLWSSVTSFDARTPLHPRLVSSRLISSYLLGSLLSHLISFKAPASQQGSSGPPLARAAPLPLAGSYRSSPRDRSTLPAAAAGLLHCGGGSLRPRVRAEAQRQRTN